jgi:hypothetical protein
MNDDSRILRHHLGTLCLRYNTMFADKDTLDFRLGSPEPYNETENETNPEVVYETESRSVSADLRSLIVELIEVAEQIRSIERF